MWQSRLCVPYLLLAWCTAFSGCSRSTKAPDSAEHQTHHPASEADAGLQPADAGHHETGVDPRDAVETGVDPRDAVEHELCNPMGYCWVQPLPFGDRIIAIDGTPDASVVFAVSQGGALLGYRDGVWQYHVLGSHNAVQSVHVRSASEIWASSFDGLYRHRDGQWVQETTDIANAIASDAQGQIWLVTRDNVVRWHDGTWIFETPSLEEPLAPSSSPYFADVVTTEDGVWVLAIEYFGRSMRCVPYHYAQGQWRQLASSPVEYSMSTPSRLITAGNDVYLSCQGDFFGRVSDTWEATAGSGWPGWGAADGTVFRENVIWRPDEGNVGTLPTTPSALWGTSVNDVWIGLASGGIMRFDGSSLVSLSRNDTEELAEVDWSTTPPEIWANADVAWGSGPNDVWRAPFEHFDGEHWTSVSDERMRAIHGSSPDNVWFALHPRDLDPNLLDLPEPYDHLLDLNGAARMAHWNGETLSIVELPSEWYGFRLSAVHTFAPNDTWLVGSKGDEALRIARYDGSSWTVVHEETPDSLYDTWRAIKGNSPHDLWAMTSDRLLHFDGSTWTERLASRGALALAVEGSDVRVLQADGIFRLTRDGNFFFDRYAYEDLSRIAFTSSHFWVYKNRKILRRRR